MVVKQCCEYYGNLRESVKTGPVCTRPGGERDRAVLEKDLKTIRFAVEGSLAGDDWSFNSSSTDIDSMR